ncbi:MAG TPA: glycosyltransferase family 87 protein [Planctomycetota bacterium]|nr:glycosyltransferase family 87 protein [Planctomycetota bacterium]
MTSAPEPDTPRATWGALGRGHRTAVVLTALFCLVVCVRGAFKGLRPQGNDYTIYHDAARALLEGRSPMSVEGWIYPPAGAWFAAPIAWLPYPVATFLWAFGSLAALVWSAWTVATLCSAPGEPARACLVWAPTALVARPIDSNFANGQINLYVFALVLAGVRALHEGRERRGAVWLGAVTALKVVPALFLVQLAARRRFAAALTGGVVAAALVLLPTLPLRGARGVQNDLARWWTDVLAPFARGGEHLHTVWPRTPGQSLTGVIYRLATDDPEQLVDRDRPPTPPTLEALHTARVRVRVVTVVLLLLLFAPLLARPAPVGGARFLTECSLVATTALFTAPLVHKAHYVWLLLPLGVAVAALFDPRSSRARRVGAGIAIGAVALLIASTAPALVGRRESTYLAVYSAIFLGAVPLHLWLATDIWRRESE